jgi:hypothetical protein
MRLANRRPLVARLLEQGELRTSLIISVTTAGVFSSLLDSGQPWRPATYPENVVRDVGAGQAGKDPAGYAA